MTQELLRMAIESDENSDHSHKYKKIFRRIGKFQDYFNEMCTLVSNYAIKTASIRDKNDEVAKCLAKFVKVEEFSTTSKLSIAIAAELIASVGDHQDLAVQRMETLVLPNLSSYGRICKCIKADVLNAIGAMSRENVRGKAVKTLRKKVDDPKYKKVVSDAERELERASAESSRLCQLSQEQVIKFEHKRLMDLKESLGTFIKIQIATHAKSLEVLSEAYKHIQSIDEDADLDILKSALRINDSSSKRKSSTLILKRGKSKKSAKSNSNLRDHRATSQNTPNAKSEDYSDASSSIIDSSKLSDTIGRLEKALDSNQAYEGERKQSVSIKRKSSHDHHKSSSKATEAYTDNVPTNTAAKIKIRDSSQDHYAMAYGGKGDSEHTRSGKKDHAHPIQVEHESDFDDTNHDEYISPTKKMLHKRPTSPARPITVPTTMGSTEDISTSYADQSTLRPKSAFSVPQAGGRKIYYYSQSEDDSLRKNKVIQAKSPSQLPSTHEVAKRVTFQSDTDNQTRRNQFSNPKSAFLLRSQHAQSGMHNSNQTPRNLPGTRETQALFPPVGSSLKTKYC